MKTTMAITEDRRTILQADIGEVAQLRPQWELSRHARDIGPGFGLPPGVVPSSNTYNTGDAWILAPRGSRDPMDLVRVPVPPAPAGILGQPDFNFGLGSSFSPSFKPASDIPGIGADPTLIPSGAPKFQRGIPAGVDASTLTLAADQVARPSPGGPFTNVYPMDRVLSGKRTHQPDAPFFLNFALPLEYVGTAIFASFHFGGPTDVTPTGHSGGQFCLMLSGTGRGYLYEWEDYSTDPNKWAFRQEVNLPKTANYEGGIYNLRIIPYARNRIAFIEDALDSYAIDAGRFALPSSGIAGKSPGVTATKGDLFIDLPAITGHSHLNAQTGPGPVRLDMRRDYLGPVMIAAMDYPNIGWVVDAPFFIDHPIPTGTPIRVSAQYYAPAGTQINITLYSAVDGTACAFDVGGQFFSSLPNTVAYYAKLVLTTSDGLQTPALRSYSVRVDQVLTTNPRVPTISTWLHSVHITGPDITPDQEQAFIHLNDPDDQLIVFRARDRVRCLLSVFSPSLNRVIAHLGEFETVQPPAKFRGKPSYQWPTPEWRDFPNMMLRGLWARVVGQYFLGEPKSFGNLPPVTEFPFDPAPPTPKGERPPWKLTDIIRFCFLNAQVPADELDIPDIPLRLWAPDTDLFGGAGTGKGWYLASGADLGRVIETLARDYFNAAIIRDPNAGTRGMWRMGFAPAAGSTNYVASFLVTDPGIPGPHQVMGVTTYSSAANVVPFQEGTFNTQPVAPEFNFLQVTGMAPGSKNSDGLIKASFPNQDSVNNPGNADYLGFFLPYFRKPDPSLQTMEACNWVAHRLQDVAGHRQLWWEGRAPLLLIRDPLDPLQNPNLFRPCRINDLCLVGGARALIRSCNPRWNNADTCQMADYEGIFL